MLELNLKKFSSSPYINAMDFLEPYLPWVLEELKLSDTENLAAIDVSDWPSKDIASRYLGVELVVNSAIVNSGSMHALAKDVKFHPSLSNKLFNIYTYPDKRRTASFGIGCLCMLYSFTVVETDIKVVVYTCLVPDSVFGDEMLHLDFAILCRENASKFLYMVDVERKKLIKTTPTIVTIDGSQGSRLTQDVNPTSWEDLILNKDITRLVKEDYERFRNKKDWYLSKKLPYRRGYLFHGSPGNGKTSMIKAIISSSNLNVYTMRNFSGDSAVNNLEKLFRSRSEGQIIVLEDLDRYFSSKGDMNKDSQTNRVSLSTLLNCLDGTSNSEGLIVLATANDPKVLGAAIARRPGRFDRVVEFPNPDEDCRERYLRLLSPEFDPEKLKPAVKGTAGLSFVQIREAYILANQLAEEEDREVSESDIIPAVVMIMNNIEKADNSRSTGFIR